jgi:hypothetical protein
MKTILNKIAVLSLTFIAAVGVAQQNSSSSAPQSSSGELTCRAKAKEIATQTYSSCVTDTRAAQIDQIRQDYQKQLMDLKLRYDKELKKVGGKDISAAPRDALKDSEKTVTSTDITTSTKKALKEKKSKTAAGYRPKATKGIAKSLPTRKESTSQAAPVNQENSDNTTVVTPQEPQSSDDEAAQNEMQLTLVPAAPPTSAGLEQ